MATHTTTDHATHVYTGTADINDGPSPFTGLRVRLIAQHTPCPQTGWDCEIELLCTAAELAERYNELAAYPGTYTPAEVAEMHADPDHAGLITCARVDTDLTAIGTW